MKNPRNILILGAVLTIGIVTSGCGSNGQSMINTAAKQAHKRCDSKTGDALAACNVGVNEAQSAAKTVYLNNTNYERHDGYSVQSFSITEKSVTKLSDKVNAVCNAQASKALNDCHDGINYFVEELRDVCGSSKCEVGRSSNVSGPRK